MIRHVVMWNHAEGFSPEERRANAIRVRNGLEALKEIAPGVIELRVCVDPLPSSGADVMLTSLFEDSGALGAYQSHPEHVKMGEIIRSVFRDRRCFDGEE